MTDDVSLRLDKWLWFARFFKSRTLATHFLESGKARMRGSIVKPAAQVRVGDVVTFSLRGAVRIVEVRSLGTRRGPALEARGLYEDLSPPVPKKSPANASPFERDPGTGRPTKADRRAIERLRNTDEDKPFSRGPILVVVGVATVGVGVLTQGRFPPPRPARNRALP